MARKLLLHCKIVKLPVEPAPSGILSCGPKRSRRPGARGGKLLPYMEGGGGLPRVEKNFLTLCTFFESRVPLEVYVQSFTIFYSRSNYPVGYANRYIIIY
jgi:hypothetical protein